MAAERRITLRARGEDWLRELDPSALNGGFSELKAVTFVGPVDRECRLLVDDEPIDPVEGAGNEWQWTPGFFAGEVRAELLDQDDRSLGVWRLDVSPDPGKAGREMFARMIEEIIDFDAHLVIGEEPARRRLGAFGETDDPLVLFERLRRRRRDLETAMAAIRREPVNVLRARRSFVPLREARRADLRTLRAAVRQPAVITAIRRSGGSSLPAVSGGEPILDVPAVERTFDAPANRCILHMLRALLLRCRTLTKQFECFAKQEQVSDTRTGVASRVGRWRQILGEMERELATAERHRPFSDGRRPEVTAAGLNAVAAHPLYARFWRVGWEALRRGVYRLEPQDLLPLSPTWELYERWCFVALAKKLQEWLPDFAWSNAGAAGSDRTLNGSHSDGRRVTLRLQQTFSSTSGKEQDESWSISVRRQPDLVVTLASADTVTRFVVLDAKYRARSSSILNGMMESVHPYADALRWGSRRPVRTLLLVPNADETEWLTRANYVETHGVGVVALRPDLELPDWFRKLLTDFPAASRERRQTALAKWTLEDYHRMVASGVLDDRPVELLRGEIVEMSPERATHAYLITEAVTYLISMVGARAVVRPDRPITLLGHDSEPEPDIAVVRPLGREYLNHHPYPDDIFWLIEYSDSSLENDLEEKRRLYAQAQVPEYWVADLRQSRLVVFRNPEGSDYGQTTTATGGELAPLAFPDLRFSVQRLLEGS